MARHMQLANKVLKKNVQITFHKDIFIALRERIFVMNMAVFWGVAPCSLVDTDQCFKGAYCLNHQGQSISTRLHSATSRETTMLCLPVLSCDLV
jgi:hypothetical protein